MVAKPDDVEIIDLTNESTRLNATINLDDSLAPIEIESSDKDDADDDDIKYSSESSPLPIVLNDDDDDHGSSSDSSSLPSR